MIDIDSIRARIGAMDVDHDEATAAPLRGLAVTFGRGEAPPEAREAIPPG